VFAKFREAAISFIMSVHLSIRPHGTTGFPLDGFSLNLIFAYFSKICRGQKGLRTAVTGSVLPTDSFEVHFRKINQHANSSLLLFA
jgi:hypothetical protein